MALYKDAQFLQRVPRRVRMEEHEMQEMICTDAFVLAEQLHEAASMEDEGDDPEEDDNDYDFPEPQLDSQDVHVLQNMGSEFHMI